MVIPLLLAAYAVAPGAWAQMAAPAPSPAVRSPAVGGGMMSMSRGMNPGSTMREQGAAPHLSGGSEPNAAECQRLMAGGAADAASQPMLQHCRAMMPSSPPAPGTATGQGARP
jgi:hypothetical protein